MRISMILDMRPCPCTQLLLIPDSCTRRELLGFPAKTFELGGPALGSVQRLPLEHLLPRVLVVRVVDLSSKKQIQIIGVADPLSRIPGQKDPGSRVKKIPDPHQRI